MDYFLHIKPTFNCLLSYNNEEQFLNAENIYTYLITNENKVNFLVYPLEEDFNSLPFAFVINNKNNNLISNYKNAEIINFPNNNYLINLQPFYFSYPKNTMLKTKEIKISNITHTISWIKNNKLDFAIENNKNENCLQLTHNSKVTEIKIKNNDSHFLCYFKTVSSTYIVILIKYENDKYTTINFEEVDILEENENKISTYKKLNDFADHGVICEYDFNNSFNFTTHLAYNSNLPFISRHKEIIPYAFFEAVKIKNYKLARVYLT